MKLNVRPYSNKQILLFPPCIEDFLPEDHEARIISDIVENLNLDSLYRKIPREGNPSYHPKMMLKVLFYAYSEGVYSSRKIMRKLERDIAYLYLSGMQKPDFRTISDFRRKNLRELRELFVQIVKICIRLGLVSLKNVSIDGTVIRANASKEKSYSRERLKKEIERIRAEIGKYLDKAIEVDEEEDEKYGKDKRGDEVPDDLRDKEKRLKKLEEVLREIGLEGKKSVNITDKDAVYQKDNDRIAVGYRAEVAVDSESQVILAYEVVNKSVDNEELIPMCEQVLENTEELRKKSKWRNRKINIVADSGFSSGKNLKRAEEIKEMNFYIPDSHYEGMRRGKKGCGESPFHVHRFKYDKRRDEYICPAGKRLKYIKRERRKYYETKTYRADKRDCLSCKNYGVCTASENGRSIRINPYTEYFLRMRKRLKSKKGKKIYKLRGQVIEPVFGNIKHNLGFNRFSLRGIEKVNGEFALIAIVHNISKIIKFIKEKIEKGIKGGFKEGLLDFALG